MSTEEQSGPPVGDDTPAVPRPRTEAAGQAGGTAADPAAADGPEAAVEAVRGVLPELDGTAPEAGGPVDLSLLGDVAVQVECVVGRARVPLRALVGLRPGAVLELDRDVDAGVDVLVNGRLVARGEVVVVDGSLGVRVLEVVRGDAAVRGG